MVIIIIPSIVISQTTITPHHMEICVDELPHEYLPPNNMLSGKKGEPTTPGILIKLFVFFVILRLFFFPDFLKTRFNTDEERGDYVLEQLTQ